MAQSGAEIYSDDVDIAYIQLVERSPGLIYHIRPTVKSLTPTLSLWTLTSRTKSWCLNSPDQFGCHFFRDHLPSDNKPYLHSPQCTNTINADPHPLVHTRPLQLTCSYDSAAYVLLVGFTLSASHWVMLSCFWVPTCHRRSPASDHSPPLPQRLNHPPPQYYAVLTQTPPPRCTTRSLCVASSGEKKSHHKHKYSGFGCQSM